MARQLKEVARFVINLDRDIYADVDFIMSHFVQFMPKNLKEHLEVYMYDEIYCCCEGSSELDEDIDSIDKFQFNNIVNRSVNYNDENIINYIREILNEYLLNSDSLTTDQFGLILSLMYSLNWEDADIIVNKILEKPQLSNDISNWKYVFQ